MSLGHPLQDFMTRPLWEEAKRKDVAAIKQLIDDGLANTSVTVVRVGAKTAGRDYINYEIDQSTARENGIVAVPIISKIRTDTASAIPAKITAGGYKAYTYVDHQRLAT